MAGRDNVLFGAPIANGATAGTVIPLSLIYGIENVRQGYGTPRLKSVKCFFSGYLTDSNSITNGIKVEIKNSNWIDSAGAIAQRFNMVTALNKDSLAFMRGRDKVLQPNTSWIINAELPVTAQAAGYIWALFEIEYSDVAGIDTEKTSGSPVMKTCKNATVAGSANAPVSIGTFDNLLQGVTYVLSEVSSNSLNFDGAFLIVEGFSNQKGLMRILPIKATGLAEQIEGSVYLTKQTYSLSVISATAINGPVSVNLEMIASQN